MAATSRSSGGRYSNFNIPENISTSVIRPSKWESKKVNAENTYIVNLARDKKNIVGLLRNILESLRSGVCKMENAKEIVIVSHYLPDNLVSGVKSLLKEYEDGQMIMEYSHPGASQSSSSSQMMKKVVKTRSKTDEEKVLSAEELLARGLIENPFGNTVSYEVDEMVPVGPTPSLQIDFADINDIDYKFLIFMFTFCLKMLSKGEDNLVNSWNTAKKNFSDKFFVGQSPSYEIPNVQQTWARQLKSHLHIDMTLSKTVIRMVSHLEAYYSPETSQAGMLRYMLCLPLSYAGMHAHKLFLQAKHLSGLPYRYLLESLVHPSTASALDCIAELLEHHEPTPDNPRNTMFRYARLIGPQYFQPLQTKACPALVYCLVKLNKKYEGEREGFNPDDIVGIKNLSRDIKNVMDRAAQAIFTTVPSDNYNMYSAIMKEASFGEKAKENPPNPDAIPNPFAQI